MYTALSGGHWKTEPLRPSSRSWPVTPTPTPSLHPKSQIPAALLIAALQTKRDSMTRPHACHLLCRSAESVSQTHNPFVEVGKARVIELTKLEDIRPMSSYKRGVLAGFARCVLATVRIEVTDVAKVLRRRGNCADTASNRGQVLHLESLRRIDAYRRVEPLRLALLALEGREQGWDDRTLASDRRRCVYPFPAESVRPTACGANNQLSATP